MSSKKRTKNKKFLRDKKMRKKGCVVKTKRNPKNLKKWKKRVGYANRLLERAKYFKG